MPGSGSVRAGVSRLAPRRSRCTGDLHVEEMSEPVDERLRLRSSGIQYPMVHGLVQLSAWLVLPCEPSMNFCFRLVDVLEWSTASRGFGDALFGQLVQTPGALRDQPDQETLQHPGKPVVGIATFLFQSDRLPVLSRPPSITTSPCKSYPENRRLTSRSGSESLSLASPHSPRRRRMEDKTFGWPVERSSSMHSRIEVFPQWFVPTRRLTRPRPRILNESSPR